MDTENTAGSESKTTRSEIIAAVSHQLRDPIAYARFVFQSLVNDAQSGLSDGDKALIKKADARLFDVFELTEKLLLADKVSYTNLPLQLENISGTDFITDLISEAGPLATKKNITLKTTSDISSVSFVADKILLREAVKNIIHNAIKYTPEGGSVTLACKNHNDSVVIEVADTGVGVTAEEASMLFSKYQRLSSAYLTSGFGLGLYLAKKFIEFHDGTITHAPNQPHGSIFTITVPHRDILST